MQYLVEQYDSVDHKISYPAGSRETHEVNNWLFFQNAGVGPMQAQANHFLRFAPKKIEYGISRYQGETRRLYGVLDRHLATSSSGYLVGDKCTIADIAHWGFVAAAGLAGVDIDEFPHLKAWEERMLARPGVEKGRHVPSPHRIKEMSKEEMEKYAQDWAKCMCPTLPDNLSQIRMHIWVGKTGLRSTIACSLCVSLGFDMEETILTLRSM